MPTKRTKLASRERNQGIAKIETLNRQLTLLNKKLALTKDLAEREKQSTPVASAQTHDRGGQDAALWRADV